MCEFPFGCTQWWKYHRSWISLLCLYSLLQIEDGGKADSLNSKLQPGDELVNINEVELNSSRQKAISLVKGSCKTLKLVVRRLVSINHAGDLRVCSKMLFKFCFSYDSAYRSNVSQWWLPFTCLLVSQKFNLQVLSWQGLKWIKLVYWVAMWND